MTDNDDLHDVHEHGAIVEIGFVVEDGAAFANVNDLLTWMRTSVNTARAHHSEDPYWEGPLSWAANVADQLEGWATTFRNDANDAHT